MSNNFGMHRPVQKINNLYNQPTDGIKQTDINQPFQQRSQQHKQKQNKTNTKKFYNSHSTQSVTEEQSIESAKAISNTNISKKELDKIKGFEIVYKMPLRLYMWDILSLLKTQKREESQNTDVYLQWLPCSGGTFQNFFCFGKDMSPYSKDYIETKLQIKSLVNCAKNEYKNNLSPIHLPNQLSYKINGIWELDVRILRAVNNYIYNSYHYNKKKHKLEEKIDECEIHISIWSNVPKFEKQKQNKFVFTNINNSYDSGDEDEDYKIKYDIYDEKTADEQILKIIQDCNDININDIMDCNQHKNITKISRQLLKTETKTDENIFDNNDNKKYEEIDTFVERICGNTDGFAIKNGYAVMMFFDTRNVPNVNAYVWREKLNKKNYENNINIGDNRINSKINNKRKYFEFNIPNSKDKINIGQYIGMDICILEQHVHQFWTIFNTETRFESSHVVNLWRDYYVNETIFEVTNELDDGFDKYMEMNLQKRNLYERYYGKQFIDRLNDRLVLFDENELVMKKNEWIKSVDNNMPDISKYKPFEYHLKKAQYGEYYGKEFIYKLHDKMTKFDKNELHARMQQKLNDIKAPELDNYGPFKFHWKRANIADDFKEGLSEFKAEHGSNKGRPIKDMNPKNFKQFYNDAVNHENEERKKNK
eukprot:397748_1